MSPATATETKSVSLVNISTEKWPPRQRTYFGSLEVRSQEPGEPYAITPIRACRGVMDLGDKRIHEIPISAQEIAEDLARELNGDSGEGSFHGVFVAAGPQPTEAELADARRRLQEFQRRLVAAADLEWERTKNPMFITDLERRAARQLGVEKPWLYDPKPMAECPACAEKIKPEWPYAAPAAPFSTKTKLRLTASSRQSERAEKDPTPPRKPMGQGSRPKKRRKGLSRNPSFNG
jgi:hypothetical protein